ncbi:NUDIX hydrolase domain-like protein [Fomitopsis serialis]|uniref:NUDIX hydrolase domain-like protein n=1 Tax=Fomitopsis serialis TaxID=139415 RepID=UPI002008CAE9|nr:NUDIX hydrolase domain-like protein [Neoantrodia serialis]KAH9932439.1 NUDIX hydrolase domain-like protein [Neoantrodia serialis]
MPESYVNFMGGSPLNRLSWLRTSHAFLNAVVLSPTTRWIVLKDGQPLLVQHSGAEKRSLARLSTADVRSLLGSEPFFAQGKLEGENAPDDVAILEAARFHGPTVVFLGLHEPQTGEADALPSSEFSAKSSDPAKVVANIKGTPVFSLDVSKIPQEVLDDVFQKSEAVKSGAAFSFSEPRVAMNGLDMFEAAIFAEARSMVDWNTRNKFCPSCGSPVYSLWAGWKLTCSSLLPWAENAGKEPCPTARGLHNFAHPRTDAVVIMAIIDESGDKLLLGRNKKWPGKFYSALAGFIEPGESFEDAVKREIWEEAGVRVWDVQYHSTQPWPYPANLMVGFYATADSSAPLRTDLDNELDDARWYTREEILAVLSHAEGTNITRSDHRKLAASQEEKGPATSTANALAGDAVTEEEKKAKAAEGPSEVPFRVPPSTAIAGVLIGEWAYGRAGPQPGRQGQTKL